MRGGNTRQKKMLHSDAIIYVTYKQKPSFSTGVRNNFSEDFKLEPELNMKYW